MAKKKQAAEKRLIGNEDCLMRRSRRPFMVPEGYGQ